MNWLNNPKTTIGALIALGGVIAIVIGHRETGEAMIGLAATWIGITSKDHNK